MGEGAPSHHAPLARRSVRPRYALPSSSAPRRVVCYGHAEQAAMEATHLLALIVTDRCPFREQRVGEQGIGGEKPRLGHHRVLVVEQPGVPVLVDETTAGHALEQGDDLALAVIRRGACDG